MQTDNKDQTTFITYIKLRSIIKATLTTLDLRSMNQINNTSKQQTEYDNYKSKHALIKDLTINY